MPRIIDRVGFALAGALAIVLVAVLGGFVQAGPLDTNEAPAPTDSVRLPGTPISSLPLTIDTPGHYYLTRSLSTTAATAILVTASDVSIDLGGFTLSGADTPGAFESGIRGSNAHRLSVSNGTVRDFQNGISAHSSDNRFYDLTLISNQTGIALGTGNVLSDCTVAANLDGVFMTGNFTEVRRCNINTNTCRGIAVNDNVGTGLVERTSLFANNQLNLPNCGGIYGDGHRLTVRDSELSNNAQRDIHVVGADWVIIDNAISCPTWITTPVPPFPPPPPTNNFAPVNSADPHTNRAHKAAC